MSAAHVEFEEAPDLAGLAAKVKERYEDRFGHIELEDVLFLWERVSKPKAIARCYQFGDHPIGMFTDRPYGIVFYRFFCDGLTENQLAVVMFHEMMHIGKLGGNLVQHDVKDFHHILKSLGSGWNAAGAEVPDILSEEFTGL